MSGPLNKENNRQNVFWDHIKGFIAGILLGAAVAAMMCYDKWKIRFDYDPTVFVFTMAIGGVFGLVFGRQFIEAIKKVDRWLGGTK